MNRILSPAEKAAKLEKRAVEGRANMARYLEHQQATLDKTARLRARRGMSLGNMPPSRRAAQGVSRYGSGAYSMATGYTIRSLRRAS